MKKIYSLLIVTLVLVSCGDKKQSVDTIIASGDLSKIRQKKADLDTPQQELAAQIKLLDAEIKKLDPQEKVPLITTFATKQEVFNHFVELQGNVDTKQNLVIFPEFSGILSKVYVKEGQKVSTPKKYVFVG